MNDDKKKGRIGASAIFWLIFALLLLAAFLINRNRIVTVLQKTGFFTKVFGSEPSFVVNHQVKTDEPMAELESTTDSEPYTQSSDGITLIPVNSTFSYTETPVVVAADQEQAPSADATDTAPQAQAVQEQTAQVEEKKEIKVSPPPAVEPDTTAKMTQHLFFIVISGDGSVLRRDAERTINKTVTPLTAAMNALLAGPDLTELEKGYMTLIPEGTQLLGASVKDGVAKINLSSEFRSNKYGVEGYYGQLAQVVYTATAFSNIDSVQFLIEGEKLDFLSEGVFIGSPLTRSSLP